MSVPLSRAQWLQQGRLLVRHELPAIAAAWGDRAVEIALDSPIADRVEAQAEAARVAAFRGVPLARDRAVIAGVHRGLRGRTVTLSADTLGYGNGEDVFVLECRPDEANGLTTLTVLRRL